MTERPVTGTKNQSYCRVGQQFGRSVALIMFYRPLRGLREASDCFLYFLPEKLREFEAVCVSDAKSSAGWMTGSLIAPGKANPGQATAGGARGVPARDLGGVAARDRGCGWSGSGEKSVPLLRS